MPPKSSDPHNAALHAVVVYLDSHLWTSLNAHLRLEPPSRSIAYCRRKVCWRCGCGGGHVLFTSRHRLLDRHKASPATALWTGRCGAPGGGAGQGSRQPGDQQQQGRAAGAAGAAGPGAPAGVVPRPPTALERALTAGLDADCQAALAAAAAALQARCQQLQAELAAAAQATGHVAAGQAAAGEQAAPAPGGGGDGGGYRGRAKRRAGQQQLHAGAEAGAEAKKKRKETPVTVSVAAAGPLSPLPRVRGFATAGGRAGGLLLPRTPPSPPGRLQHRAYYGAYGDADDYDDGDDGGGGADGGDADGGGGSEDSGAGPERSDQQEAQRRRPVQGEEDLDEQAPGQATAGAADGGGGADADGGGEGGSEDSGGGPERSDQQEAQRRRPVQGEEDLDEQAPGQATAGAADGGGDPRVSAALRELRRLGAAAAELGRWEWGRLPSAGAGAGGSSSGGGAAGSGGGTGAEVELAPADVAVEQGHESGSEEQEQEQAQEQGQADSTGRLPLWVAEARSLPGRRRWAAPDVSLFRPLGGATDPASPFGAVMQTDGLQHVLGSMYDTAAEAQRAADAANDLDAWRSGLAVLRLAADDAGALPVLRPAFLRLAAANPGVPLLMYSQSYLRRMDWDWALRVLAAGAIYLPGHCRAGLGLPRAVPGPSQPPTDTGRRAPRGGAGGSKTPGAGTSRTGRGSGRGAGAGGAVSCGVFILAPLQPVLLLPPPLEAGRAARLAQPQAPMSLQSYVTSCPRRHAAALARRVERLAEEAQQRQQAESRAEEEESARKRLAAACARARRQREQQSERGVGGHLEGQRRSVASRRQGPRGRGCGHRQPSSRGRHGARASTDQSGSGQSGTSSDLQGGGGVGGSGTDHDDSGDDSERGRV